MNPIQELDDDLPDEILHAHAQDAEARSAKIAALSMVISRKRDEAVTGRANSGIEAEWAEDADAYEGIDDANRSDQKVIKPSTSAGGITRKATQSTTRSTVFLNITRPYVDSAAARIGDMLMPTDDRSWQLKVEPVADLTSVQQPVQMMGTAQPAPTQPGQPPVAPTPVQDAIQAQLDEAQKPVDRAQRRIDDWLTESQWHAECRKVIDDCCRIGVGVLKGPFPTKSRAKKVSQTPDGVALEIMMKVKPASKRVDPWNCYPDPACGEDIHQGNYFIEHDQLTEKQLRALRGLDGYLDDQIAACIKEGPQKKYAASQNPSDKERNEKDLYDVWYFYGSVSADDLIAANVDGVKEGDDSKYAIVTLVNDRAIKCALNPLDSGEFPYDVTPYQRRSGTWTGIGVARQVRAPQGMINAGTRNMMDNAALSGGPIFAIDRQMLEPITGGWELTPRKGFYTTAAAEGRSIKDAMAVFDIPSRQQELMNIIQFALKMAEDVTGMPMLLQGQTGSAPDTLGGQLMANNNAAAVLRRFARLWDDMITEPHIRRYYEYLLIYGEDDSEKGVFTVDARGSSALVERDIQNHAAMQMLQFSANPIFGIDPKKAAEEALKAQRLDPKRFQYSKEEQAKMAAQPPAPPVQVMVEQVRGQNALQAIQAKTQGELQLVQQEAQHEQQALMQGGATPHMAAASARIEQERIRAATAQTVEASRANAEMARAEKEKEIADQNGQYRVQELMLKKEIALLQYSTQQKINLDQAKVQLAKSSMDNETKRQLAAAEIELARSEGHHDRALDLHKHQTSLVRDEISTPATP